MLQQDKPDDFVISTGETHTIKEFCELAFSEVGIDVRWEGEYEDEKGFNKATGEIIVDIDKNIFDPRR